jgi:hypothetical protein
MSLNKESSLTGDLSAPDIAKVDSMMKNCSLDTKTDSGMFDMKEVGREDGGTGARLVQAGSGVPPTIPTDDEVLEAFKILCGKDKKQSKNSLEDA